MKSDLEIKEAICKCTGLHMYCFTEAADKRFMYFMPVKSNFVIDMLTYFGVPLAEAKLLSEEKALEFARKELWSGSDIFNFVKQQIEPQE